MSLIGITGNNIHVRELKPNVSLEQLKGLTKGNNLDEIVVENPNSKFIIFASKLDIIGKFGLPAVGSQVNFGDVHGKVILSNLRPATLTRQNTDQDYENIKDICKATPEEQSQIDQEAKNTVNAMINGKITEAEKKSESNTNTISIYGPQVTKEDAESWLKNNPDLSKSPKLVKLADFKTIDGKVDADELAKISTGGAVVLNGPNSFYLPGEQKSQSSQTQVTITQAQGPGKNNQPTRQPLSAQEQFYKRKNQEAAIDAAAGLTGAIIDGFSGILR